MTRTLRISAVALLLALLAPVAGADPGGGGPDRHALAVAGPVERIDRIERRIEVGGIDLRVPPATADLARIDLGTRVAVWYERQGEGAVATALEVFEEGR